MVVDLKYRAEVHGITQHRLAQLIGCSLPTLKRWSSSVLEQPAWLADWLEYMDMELIAGRTPEKLPRGRAAIDAFLYPSKAAQKRPRAPNGSRAPMLAERDARRSLRLLRAENRRRLEENLQTRGMEPIELVDQIRKKLDKDRL